jgi:hypothetical protein
MGLSVRNAPSKQSASGRRFEQGGFINLFVIGDARSKVPPFFVEDVIGSSCAARDPRDPMP